MQYAVHNTYSMGVDRSLSHFSTAQFKDDLHEHRETPFEALHWNSLIGAVEERRESQPVGQTQGSEAKTDGFPQRVLVVEERVRASGNERREDQSASGP